MPVPDRRLYRPRPACSCGTRTPYAPGTGAEPYHHPVCRAGDQDEGTARRNPDKGVPTRQPYRPPRRYLSHSRTPYAPGAGEPGSGEGNAEQSAPAARSVAIARRASDTESGSPASYTTPQTTRRPRLAWTNHRRRSAHGTIVTRQSRILTHLPTSARICATSDWSDATCAHVKYANTAGRRTPITRSRSSHCPPPRQSDASAADSRARSSA